METITVRGIPIEILLQVYDARERTRERIRANRQESDRQYRQAHAEQRRAYNREYYARKIKEIREAPGYVPPRRGPKPKVQAEPQAANLSA